MLESTHEPIRHARPFRDRIDAGRKLAAHLGAYRGKGALVLGIPRGGVPVAAEVAQQLGADLDVVVARKLGAPHHEELAIGAVTADGGRFLNEDVLQEYVVSHAYLEQETARQTAEAHRREHQFRGVLPPPVIEGRVVILVDDGMATGATMRAAVQSVHHRRPRRLVVAVPVGSPEACAAVRAEVDEVVCLYEPEFFLAVGQFYEQFTPTDDREVTDLLQKATLPQRDLPDRTA